MSKAVGLGRSDFARLRSWFHAFIASGITRVIAVIAACINALIPGAEELNVVGAPEPRD